jgi:hypothetical protein
MREGAQGFRVGDPLDGPRAAGGNGFVGHDAKLSLQRTLCKQIFAKISLESRRPGG